MKQKFHFCAVFLLLVFLLTSEQLTARVLSANQAGEGEAEKLDVVGDFSQEMENTDSVYDLMGLEGCENGDNECFDRRILAEVHLDYIYTQHHKP